MEKFNKAALNNMLFQAVSCAACYVFDYCVCCPAGQYTAAEIDKKIFGGPRSRDWQFKYDENRIKNGVEHQITDGVRHDGHGTILIDFQNAGYTCAFPVSRVFAMAARFLKLADDAKLKKHYRKIFWSSYETGEEHNVEFADGECYGGKTSSGTWYYYMILAHNRHSVTVLDGDTGSISSHDAYWRDNIQGAYISTSCGEISLDASVIIKD